MKVTVYLLIMWLSPTGPYVPIPTAPIYSEADCIALAASIRKTGYVKCLPYEAVIGTQSCAGSQPLCAQ